MVSLIVVNYTESPLALHDDNETPHLLLPNEPYPTSSDKSPSISIRAASSPKATDAWIPDIESTTVRLQLKLGRKWRRCRGCEHGVWDVYEEYLEKDKYAILIFEKRNPATFLSSIPDSVPLSGLLLPGTHQTMAFKGWPLAQCQSRSTPLLTQLRAGVRVLDIRLSLYNGALGTAHDVLPMGTRFVAVLADLRNFLTHDGVHETVVVSIKQEDGRRTPAHLFSAAVRREILAHDAGLGGWFLEHRIPTLGEVRGRAVLFARFGDDDGAWGGRLGIHPRAWPDSAPEGFAWRCAGTPVRVHDWYRVPTFLSIPEKLRRATRVLCPDAWADADEDVRPAAAWRRHGYAPLYTAELPAPRTDALGIAFLSASAIPFALPPTIARGFGWPRFGLGVEGVNARFTRWCLRKLAGAEEGRCDPRIRGWVLMDFVAEPSDMVGIMIELNWRGRVVGEEGWTGD